MKNEVWVLNPAPTKRNHFHLKTQFDARSNLSSSGITRQAMYVQRNIAVRSRNHCYLEKRYVLYMMSVCAALVIQH
jgi:hypothetical protein